MRGPEGKLQDKLRDYAKSVGLVGIKLSTMSFKGTSGWPDWLFLGRVAKKMADEDVIGRTVFFFVEVKAPGKKPTPLQAEKQRVLKAFGFTVYTVDNLEDGKRAVNREVK